MTQRKRLRLRYTLPLILFQLMNSYRMDDASACAVLLMAISFGLFWIFDRGGRLA